MDYREMGLTGRQVSAIGLGCEHLDGKPYVQIKETIDVALAHGVNILDVFMPGREIRENIAKALGNRRKDVMIQGHICSTDVHKQYGISRDLPTARRYFEDALRAFGGHIEFGMFFFIDSEEDYRGVFETGIAEYAQSLKAQGDIGHIGFSSHNPVTAIKAINTGLPEILMFSINPAFDMLPPDEYVFDHLENNFGSALFKGIDPRRAELYKLCAQKGIGISVMKALAAGKLLSPAFSPFAGPLALPQCIHYALSRPAVASVLLGCQTRGEMLEALGYFDLDETQRDYAEALGAFRNDFTGSCVYCSHCQPCPMGIDIAGVHRCLDTARLDALHIPASIRGQYSGLPHGGGACSSCGQCEGRCPFGVPIMANMAEAERLLGAG